MSEPGRAPAMMPMPEPNDADLELVAKPPRGFSRSRRGGLAPAKPGTQLRNTVAAGRQHGTDYRFYAARTVVCKAPDRFCGGSLARIADAACGDLFCGRQSGGRRHPNFVEKR